jgi:hypothetical protein
MLSNAITCSQCLSSAGNGGSASRVRRRWSEANSFGRADATLSQSSNGSGSLARGSCSGRKPRSESTWGAAIKVNIHDVPHPAWWSSVCERKHRALGYFQNSASDMSLANLSAVSLPTARLPPPSYGFENMRTITTGGTASPAALLAGASLVMVYTGSRRTGFCKRLSACCAHRPVHAV